MSSVPTWPPHFPRVYNTVSGKQKKCYKGTQGDEGSLLKVSVRDHTRTPKEPPCLLSSVSLFTYHTKWHPPRQAS